MDTDVLIVGAGPTGLMLANQLGRRGVRVMIVDRHGGPARQTRAIGVQARTLEIYAKLGIAPQALSFGANTGGVNIWAQAKHKARIPVSEAGKGLSPYPFVLMLGQDDNERIMGEKLRDWGLAVSWNTELVSLQQHSDRVDVALKQSDGSIRNLSAAWIAGCDGSRSSVRECCGITFPGAPYEHVFFVADTVATGSMVPGELNAYLWKKGFHLFFPLKAHHGKDRWRVIGILPDHLRDREDLRFEDVIPDVRKEAGASLAFEDCLWFSTYRIHHRTATRFRDGRCFLLGDAAHIHSPMGAQGMNTGLQDAYNLAWKLAMVVKAQAGATLLDSYEAERMPVAQRLLRTTDRVFMQVVSETRLAAMLRTRVIGTAVALAMRSPRIRALAFRTISQTGIRYRNSPLSRTLADLPELAPRAGDRFPWMQVRLRSGGAVEDIFEKMDDTRLNLIVVGQPAPQVRSLGLGDWLRVHTIADDPVNRRALARARITAPAFYLLRPDGHVGLAGGSFSEGAVVQYLLEHNILLTRDIPFAPASLPRAV